MRQTNAFCEVKKNNQTYLNYVSLGSDMEKNKHRHHEMRQSSLIFCKAKGFQYCYFFFQVNKDLFMSNSQKFGVMTGKIIIKPN